MSRDPVHGGCCCGAVRFELRSELQGVYYCHCRDCQRLSGSAYHVLGIVARASLVVLSGQLSTYSTTADSGYTMARQFCTVCGTPLFLESERFPEIIMFTVSSLDSPQTVEPSFEIWTSSKLPWSAIRADLASFPRGALDGPS